MSKRNSIRDKYNDVLFWAESNLNKNESYYLTQCESNILRKLIHYSSKNERITYSNETISDHTFINVGTIKNIIPKLANKGYINSASIRIKQDGIFITRRSIYINWEFIENVLKKIIIKDRSVDTKDTYVYFPPEVVKEIEEAYLAPMGAKPEVEPVMVKSNDDLLSELNKDTKETTIDELKSGSSVDTSVSEYSDITFTNNSDKVFLVPSKLVDYFTNELPEFKRIIGKLKECQTQGGFDYILNNQANMHQKYES